MLLSGVFLLMRLWRYLYIYLYFLCVRCRVSLVALGRLCCKFGNHNSSLMYILHFSDFLRFHGILPTLMVFNALTLLICSSQFSLLFKVIPKNWVLFLCDMIWFLSVISFLCFFMYSLYSNVLKLFKYLLSVDSVISFLNVKDNCSYFLLSFKFIKDFCCYFWLCINCASLFPEVKLPIFYFFLLLQMPSQSFVCHHFKHFAKYIS